MDLTSAHIINDKLTQFVHNSYKYNYFVFQSQLRSLLFIGNNCALFAKFCTICENKHHGALDKQCSFFYNYFRGMYR